MEQIQITLDKKLKDQIYEICEQFGFTKSEFIRTAIRAKIKEEIKFSNQNKNVK